MLGGGTAVIAIRQVDDNWWQMSVHLICLQGGGQTGGHLCDDETGNRMTVVIIIVIIIIITL